MRRVTLATLAVCALSACGQKEETPQAPPAETAPLAGPLTYEKKTPQAEVRLALPEAVGRLPALYAKLYAEDRNRLDAFAEGAVEDVESMKAQGFPANPYAMELDYTVAAETPRLISLKRVGYEFTGGAHPNPFLSGLTWDKAEGKTLAPTDLFKPGADLSGADTALCEATKAAKRARSGGDDTFIGEPIACPTLAKAETVLIPSTTAGKIGGLKVLIGPYDIGPYAEGAYEIVLPLGAFQAALAPAYAAEFAGAPAPEPAPKAE